MLEKDEKQGNISIEKLQIFGGFLDKQILSLSHLRK